MIRGQPRLKQADARRRLAGLERGRVTQIIEPAPGMGLDIGKRLVLGGQIAQHPREHGVFVDIGGIARVIMVLIAEHDPR
jgi:hypothetical protein